MRSFIFIGLLGVFGCTTEIENKEIDVAPTFTGIFIAPDSNITSSTELLCVATADDENNERISLAYEWTKTDASVIGTIDRLQLTPERVGPSEEITCTVTAGDGSTTITTSASVSIENSDPIINHVSITPEIILVHSLLACTFDAYDPDQEELTARYSWTQNGTEVGIESSLQLDSSASDIDPEDANLTYTYLWSSGETGPNLILDGSEMPGTEITCNATATDTSGATISFNATNTLMNRAPTVDSVSLPQDATALTASILCGVATTDLDGESPTITYAWIVEGAPVKETTSTFTGPFVYGEIIE